MTTYNYKCSKCENVFNIKATLQEKEEGGEKFVCPKCGSKEIKQNFSAIKFIKNIFASNNKGGCCCGENICNINDKRAKNNSDECIDKKDSDNCCR